jgi:hypothetical protein
VVSFNPATIVKGADAGESSVPRNVIPVAGIYQGMTKVAQRNPVVPVVRGQTMGGLAPVVNVDSARSIAYARAVLDDAVR